MQGDTATYSQTLSQVNIAVHVQLRNVTRIAETVEAAGLELSPTGQKLDSAHTHECGIHIIT